MCYLTFVIIYLSCAFSVLRIGEFKLFLIDIINIQLETKFLYIKKYHTSTYSCVWSTPFFRPLNLPMIELSPSPNLVLVREVREGKEKYEFKFNIHPTVTHVGLIFRNISLNSRGVN